MDQVAEVRSKVDLISLIQEFLPLKKTGHNFKTNCPFHGEKTPSFVVSPERQIWHCFGCGKGGDAFTFLMEYERIEFPEALRILADKTGVKLVQQHYDPKATSKKEKFYALNRLAAEFYHYLLTKHTLGKPALAYVEEKRKVKTQTLSTFLLGYAPRGNALTTYLTKKKGYVVADLIEAGLSTKRLNGQVIDFFQDRLMFALFDHRDNIIGFSGRIMHDDEKTSKYINTKETLLYHKGMTFFGFNIAKESIKRHNQAILMEGEFDVISSFQEGITNTVAVKGTALTEDQVSLLSRFCQKVTLCFDTDAAGQEAMKRSLALLEKKGLTTSVIVIPQGKDADEAIKENPAEFKKAVKDDMNVYEYLIHQASGKYNTTTVEGKRQISNELLPLLSHIDNEIVKEHYLTQLAGVIGTSYESLIREIEKLRKQEVVRKPVVLTKVARLREDILEEYLVGLLVQAHSPKLILEKIADILTGYEWRMPAFQRILEEIVVYTKNHEIFDQATFLSVLPQELVSAFDTCYLLPLPSFTDEDKYSAEAVGVAKDLREQFVKAKVKSLSESIKQKEKQGLGDEVVLLQTELSSLLASLSGKV